MSPRLLLLSSDLQRHHPARAVIHVAFHPPLQPRSAAGSRWSSARLTRPVRLESRGGVLFAAGSAIDAGVWGSLVKGPDREVVRLDPLVFFIPESVADPSIRKAGEELWVEVTIPRAGPRRPIRLAVSKNGTLTELALR